MELSCIIEAPYGTILKLELQFRATRYRQERGSRVFGRGGRDFRSPFFSKTPDSPDFHIFYPQEQDDRCSKDVHVLDGSFRYADRIQEEHMHLPAPAHDMLSVMIVLYARQ